MVGVGTGVAATNSKASAADVVVVLTISSVVDVDTELVTAGLPGGL